MGHFLSYTHFIFIFLTVSLTSCSRWQPSFEPIGAIERSQHQELDFVHWFRRSTADFNGASQKILTVPGNQNPNEQPAAWQVGSDLEIPAHITLKIPVGVVLRVKEGSTLRIQSCPDANDYQIFDADEIKTGSVRFSKGSCNDGVLSSWWGAKGDGIADDTPAIQSAFSASDHIRFPARTFLMNSGIVKLPSNTRVDFGGAKFINGGANFLFTFGATSDVPIYSGLEITGGLFEQSVPGTFNNQNYLRIAGTKNFFINGASMKNVSNGGIYVEAGAEDGVIDGVTIEGQTGYAVIRGIWLNGGSASDYASQLIDVSSIARNDVPLPQFAAKRVRISNSKIRFVQYGVYLMNTRDVQIENNHIDISGSGGRNIAINNYSPGAIVRNNLLIGDQSSTGILATQFSHDVLIEGNRFKGTFHGGRDIYVSHLAQAKIQRNVFETDSTQQILIDMGGSAVIQSNEFTRSTYGVNTRVVRIDTIDAAVVGTGTYGNTAKLLPKIVFEDNIVRVRNAGVVVFTHAAQNGNVPGLESVTVRNNMFYNLDTAAGIDEFGLRIYANGPTNLVRYSYYGNVVFPEGYSSRNIASVDGSGAIEEPGQ